jgi:hypothetical protein
MIYVLEMGLKLIVLGPTRYLASKSNVFDGLVTIASFITSILVVSPGVEKFFVCFYVLFFVEFPQTR